MDLRTERRRFVAGGPLGDREGAAMAADDQLDRLASEARTAAEIAALERRQARLWRIRAVLLALSQEPTTADAYLGRVVDAVARQLDAAQVVFWRYRAEADAYEAGPTSSPAPLVAVPRAVFQAAVADRQPMTAAMPSSEGGLQPFLLAPVFEADALLGVFQVVPPEPVLDPGTEEALAAVSATVAQGLRTVRFFEQLSYQASHDPLTGLANRRTFEAFLDREVRLTERHGTPVSVIVVDADHFKKYNDTYGHPAGDALLKALAARLAQVVRSTDFVARIGGEEFVVVLPHTDQAGAQAAAEKVLQGIRTLHEHAVVLGGKVTASLGVATYPGDVFDARELFNVADQALYRAKQAGRDRFCAAS